MTPLARIALYVVAGYLMRGGWLPEDMAHQLSTDPDMVFIFEATIGAAVSAVTLVWWRIAKRMGWNT